MSKVDNKKEVANFTLFDMEVELIERFKKFSKKYGIRRLPDALKLLLDMSEQGTIISHMYNELMMLKSEMNKENQEEVQNDRKRVVKTFGGEKKE